MNFAWTKRYLPRGLYGRAALILLVPIITLQVVVSLVFIQRHFEDVTRQMSRSLAYEVRYVLDVIDDAPDVATARAAAETVAAPLALEVVLPQEPPQGPDARRFYDLSGRVVISTLRGRVKDALVFDILSDTRKVKLWADTPFGPAYVAFDRNRVSASNPHQFLVLMVFVGLLMTLVAFIFMRNQLRPIRRLAKAAEAFGKGRIEEYRPSGAIEVRSAGNAFLDMRARIERQIEQRTMMLSGVSHDLRTPLTRLKLGLSVIEDASDAAELIRDVEDMERLLDEFLAFARGDALDDLSPADPAELVRAVVADAQRAGGNVEIGALDEGTTAQMRPIAVKRALENLVGNALRYGSRARVGVTVLDRAIRFTVEDDGPGIPPDQRGQAVKPFVRLDSARNQNRGSGAGLGLAIANDIARRHGGSVRLGSSADLGGLRADLLIAR